MYLLRCRRPRRLVAVSYAYHCLVPLPHTIASLCNITQRVTNYGSTYDASVTMLNMADIQELTVFRITCYRYANSENCARTLGEASAGVASAAVDFESAQVEGSGRISASDRAREIQIRTTPVSMIRELRKGILILSGNKISVWAVKNLACGGEAGSWDSANHSCWWT